MLQGQTDACFAYVHQCFSIPMIFKSVLTVTSLMIGWLPSAPS